jgi:probable HAF family extracellular repeat protein
MIDLGTGSSASAINGRGQVVGAWRPGFPNIIFQHASLITPEDVNGDGTPDTWFRDLNSDGVNDLVTDLGTLGGAVSWPNAINNRGQVVGWADTGGVFPRSHAFLWESGTMSFVESFPGASGSEAKDINNLGHIVGSAAIVFTPTSGGPRAFLNKDGDVINLGTFPGVTGASAAHGINDQGQIVGFSVTASGYAHAALWRVVDGFVGTGGGTVADTDPTGARFSVAAGVLSGETSIAIEVLPNPGVNPPAGFAGIETLFVNITLDPNPGRIQATITLPLASRLPEGTSLALFKFDPGTGTFVDTRIVGTVDQGGATATFSGVIEFSIFVGLQPTANRPPLADAGPDQIVSAGADCLATVTLNGTGSSDPDGDALAYMWIGPFGTAIGATPAVSLPLGTHTITLTVGDGKGETASDTVVVQVKDTTPPVLTAPAPITKEATGALTPATVPFPAFTDCSVVDVTSDAPALFPLGTTTVTFTATDAWGNRTTAATTVTITDTTPPTLTVPGAITKEATAPLTPVTLGTATAVDLVDGAVAVSNNAPAAGFPVGTTVVTWTATDSHGNKATATQSVKITDTTPPTGTLSLSPGSLWPPNHRMVTITRTLTASDLAGPVTISGPTVSSNEPIDGLGDGDTSPDWIITGAGGIQLRAERSGTGNGRVYTVTYVVTDQSGNSTTVSATVLVPKSQGR